MDSEDKYRIDHPETCDFYKNLNDKNPQYREIRHWQIQKFNMYDSKKVEEFENSKRYILFEKGKKKRRRAGRNFCDGQHHYESWGTDPTYWNKGYCPRYWEKAIKFYPEGKRGIL